MSSPHFDPATREVVLPITNGWQLRSGFLDHADPDARPAGGYISVIDSTGAQRHYSETPDLAFFLRFA